MPGTAVSVAFGAAPGLEACSTPPIVWSARLSSPNLRGMRAAERTGSPAAFAPPALRRAPEARWSIPSEGRWERLALQSFAGMVRTVRSAGTAARPTRAADEIVQFTIDLVRIPTVNPPGEAYEACARFLGAHLERRAFDVEYIAADGLAEHTARHPRVNVIGSRRGGPGPVV